MNKLEKAKQQLAKCKTGREKRELEAFIAELEKNQKEKEKALDDCMADTAGF